MMSCILVLYIALSGDLNRLGARPAEWSSAIEASRAQSVTPGDGDPDALYARRDDLTSARQAERIWSERLAKNPKDFESAWKLSRARYWLGGHAPEQERKAVLEAGVAAGRAAARAEPGRPEGHFWMAANMGALAEAHGLRQGLRYRSEIKDALQTVLKLDPAYQQGSADRALGRWYYKVPGLFGGSKTKSEEHLRKSLTYNPNSTSSLYFLAETLVALDRDAEAKAALQRILDIQPHPDWIPEDREFKGKARKLLQTLKERARDSSRLPPAGCDGQPNS